jgi:H+-transporting ATPase
MLLWLQSGKVFNINPNFIPDASPILCSSLSLSLKFLDNPNPNFYPDLNSNTNPNPTLIITLTLTLTLTEPPRDALDSLTLSQADLNSLDNIEQTEFMPFDPIGNPNPNSNTIPNLTQTPSLTLTLTLQLTLTLTLTLTLIVKRTEGTIRDTESGEMYKTTKGAPHVILELCNDAEVRYCCH